MHDIAINWLAVIAAAAIHFVTGAVWYSPLLFVRAFQQEAGVSDADMKAALPKGMAFGVVLSLIMAFVLVHAVKYAGAPSFAYGAMVGFWNWLGFVVVVEMQHVLWSKWSLRRFAIIAGAELVSLALMGGLLAAWP